VPQLNVLQPQYFERFRCLGSECEDTCCDGWGILIDRHTFGKYRSQEAPHHGLVALSSLVEINPAHTSSGDYAKIRLAGTRCPALQDGLCSIHANLGEPWISDMCSNYPRVGNSLAGLVERSLHLSCPEAARLVLNDPDALRFEELRVEQPVWRPETISSIDPEFAAHLKAARENMVEILRERCRPVWLRMAALGIAVDRLADLGAEHAAPILVGCLENLRQGAFDHILQGCEDSGATQLETVLELVVARIGSEYTSPRFLDCYRDFMSGLGWTAQSTMEELAARYRLLLRGRLQPFTDSHPHFFENYLINNVFRSLFPWGRRLPDQRLCIDSSGASIRNAFILLATHYGVIRTLLTGVSGICDSGISTDLAVKLVQSHTKAFQHSGDVASALLRFLAQQPGSPILNAIGLIADGTRPTEQIAPL
jgi:lysine-N-methylase